MHFPNLPTDNLYKFLALSGVVVVLASIFYPKSRLGEIQQRVIEVTAEMRILDLENKRLTVIQSRLEKDLATLKKQESASELRKRPTRRNFDSMKRGIDEH